MEEVIAGFNVSHKKPGNYYKVFYDYNSSTEHGYCSCGYVGTKATIEGEERTCPNCGVKSSDVVGVNRISHRNYKRMIPLEIKATSDEFYYKLFEIDSVFYVDSDGFEISELDKIYIHEISFGYETNKKGIEKFKRQHLVNGEKIPFRKDTLTNLYSYYSCATDFCDYDDFNPAFEKICKMKWKDYSTGDKFCGEDIWEIHHFYRNLRNLLKLNYVDVYASSIEELKELDRFAETIDKRFLAYINNPLLKPTRSPNAFKRFFNYINNQYETEEELLSYYDSLIEFNKIYPMKTCNEVYTLVKMKDKLKYTLEEMDELIRKIDNQAFKNVPGVFYETDPLSHVYKAQLALKKVGLPGEKVPKELAIYVTKAMAIYAIRNITWNNSKKINEPFAVCLESNPEFIKKVYDTKGFKMLDDILIDYNMNNIGLGFLKVSKDSKYSLYKDYFIQMEKVRRNACNEYDILKLMQVKDNQIIEVIEDKDEILKRIEGIIAEKEVALND